MSDSVLIEINQK